MAHQEKNSQSLLRRIKGYFSQGLGDFYSHSANRLMLYPFLAGFFFVECLTFWLIYQGPAFFIDYMAFTTVYSLHKALVYTLCMFGADVLAHRLVPAWGGYARRTVGRQWLIWALGIAAGFVVQRTMIGNLIVLYAPDVLRYFMNHPQDRLGNGTLLMFLAPYWAALVFVSLQVAMSKQKSQRRAGSMAARGEHGAAGASPPAKPRSLPAGNLQLDGANGGGAIALADVTHISVEDHYCRVTYSTGDGLKNQMIRMPLKEMMSRLPPEHFLQTHRSHVVNLGHVSRLAKSGRDHKVVLNRFDVEVPVSRSRFKQLRPWLKPAQGVQL
jgi:LytTr DNA-binding domain-containing protein